ncbi:class I SAM-dependent methyltransferase [bacterium SCSIO 12696]|nr:class I SAM-dependent methyltransferase [bacterium SCSIO 12696]
MHIKRLHLIEIEDQHWCPKPIRNGITDILRFNLNTGKIYHPIIPLFLKVLEKTGSTQVIDLCSGGGGPWPSLLKALPEERDLHLHFTDKYPNVDTLNDVKRQFSERVTVHSTSNDATDLSLEHKGLRTLFTSFHHFTPESARLILNDAVKKNQPIAIFEFTHRSPLALLLMLFAFIAVFFVAPFAKPFRWSRLVFTYLIPLLPLIGTFDGIVSCLRTYTHAEMNAMIDSLGADHYHWETGEHKSGGPVPITYLMGYPKDQAASHG